MIMKEVKKDMSDFKWSIWFEKWGKNVILLSGATIALFTADYITENPLPTEYVFWSGLLIIVLQQIGNYIKHTFFGAK